MGSDLVQLRDIHKKFGQRPLRNYPVSNILRHKVYLRYFRGIRVERPLNYVPYIKEEAAKFLDDEYGWQLYTQKHFESRFTQFYEGYWLPTKFGYDTRRVQFSSLIVTNQMSREEALDLLKKPSYDEDKIVHEFEYIATKLGISVGELQECMDLPNKTYKDYKSQLRTFIWGTKVLRALGVERRTIR